MTTQAPPMSQDLTAARELLDKLDAATRGDDTDSQTTAIAAAAHSILVLAEQVAVIRVLMVEEARLRHANGHSAPGANGQPAAQVEDTGQPAGQADHAREPAPQDKPTRRKRGWF